MHAWISARYNEHAYETCKGFLDAQQTHSYKTKPCIYVSYKRHIDEAPVENVVLEHPAVLRTRALVVVREREREKERETFFNQRASDPGMRSGRLIIKILFCVCTTPLLSPNSPNTIYPRCHIGSYHHKHHRQTNSAPAFLHDLLLDLSIACLSHSSPRTYLFSDKCFVFLLLCRSVSSPMASIHWRRRRASTETCSRHVCRRRRLTVSLSGVSPICTAGE